MDALQNIAKAHFDAAPRRVKALAENFFRALDSDGNGRVSMREFMAFMSQYGDERLSYPEFFRELDRDRNGVLDFWEVMTLYYIVKSRRPFCDSCNKFIKSIYYSCVACFHTPDGPFNLCPLCYQNRRYIRHMNYHNGRVQFLDNYTMLEVKRQTSTPPPPLMRRSYNQRGPSYRPQGTARRQSNALVPASMNGWSQAFQAMEIGISVGNVSITLCSTL